MLLSLPHVFGLVVAIAVGAALRFWQLAGKPFWLDETITTLFALGRNYQDVPLGTFVPLSELAEIFQWQSASCPEIAQVVAVQSTHPPLFFCLMHTWLGGLRALPLPLDWQLRALPALLGVGAIAAVYGLNRVAFTPAAGLMAAALMAVSPFAVYLSQEARHYSLPMLLITLALLGLVQMQQDLSLSASRWVGYPTPAKLRLPFWLGWVAINGLGFYVHYFFLLAFVAQVLALLGWILLGRPRMSRSTWLAVGGAIAGVVLIALPWLPIFLSHRDRPETDWLQVSWANGWEALAPIYQLLAGCIVMVVMLPVEAQPLWLAIPAVLLMILFAVWVGWQMLRGLSQLWQSPQTRAATQLLGGFTLWVLLQYLAIAFLLGKDLTVAFRYNFTFYPAVCALLGASLVNLPSRWFQRPSYHRRRGWWSWFQGLPWSQMGKRQGTRPIQGIVLLVGFCSCLFVVTGLSFQKPFLPQQVAQDLVSEPHRPLLVVQNYSNWQDVARGLSLVRAVERYGPTALQARTFWSFSSQTAAPWEQLPPLPPSLSMPFNLWLVNAGRYAVTYVPEFRWPERGDRKGAKGGAIACQHHPSDRPQLGTARQRYLCQQVKAKVSSRKVGR